MADSDDQLPKHPGGRPLKYQTVEELDLAIQNYFADCDPHTTKALVETGQDSKGNMLFDTRTVLTEQKPYLVTGLARALGVSRQTLLNYRERKEFFDSITEAVQRCEEYAESQLYGPFANGAKFNLVNNYQGKYQDWSDKTAVDHTTKDQPIPLLAGLAPAKLEVDDDAAPADDSSHED
ncbi:terminase small subunit [Mycolicibacterium sp. S3B2]|uniref:terminase small subunit n=1 Tax=Mycolicibacterium sp. S3B2 TaxID=3415120 RepID=UPI003C7B334D